MKLRLLLLGIIISTLGLSQSNDMGHAIKNSFTIYGLAFSNFDESRIFHQPLKLQGSMPLGVGSTYSRQLKSGNYLDFDISIGRYQNPFYQDFFENGTVDARSLSTFSISSKRNIFTRKNGALHYLIGGSFRLGREIMHDNYYSPGAMQCIILDNQLTDLGSNLGLQYSLNLGKHLHVNSLLSYSFYPLTVDYRDVYNGDKGAAKHALQLKVGIGYHYGKGIANSELEKDHKNQVGKKHQLTIYKSIYQFFDGSPMVQDKGQYAQLGPNIAGSYGVSYQNKINDKWYWLVGIEDFEFRNSIPRNSAPNGTIISRNFGLLDVSVLRSLMERDQLQVSGKLGLNFRYGFEHIIGERIPAENTNKTLEKDYRDLGINSGLKVQWFTKSFVHFSSAINYTYLPLTYGEKDPSYFWDNGPNKHMISFSLGLGLNK